MPPTPGPWTYAYEGSGSHNVYDIANDMLVAECGCDYGRDESGDNARLIAQAPVMYALLKELEWSTSMWNSNPTCPSMPAKMKSQEEHIADADAILAENGEALRAWMEKLGLAIEQAQPYQWGPLTSALRGAGKLPQAEAWIVEQKKLLVKGV
jgi:hypothetical protein